MEFILCITLQAYLAKSASLNIAKSLKPISPSTFGFHMVSHFTYLGSFKWSQEYHEVCLINFTSGIIENMKTPQRNKFENADIFISRTSWELMIFDTSQSIELHRSRISRSDF